MVDFIYIHSASTHTLYIAILQLTQCRLGTCTSSECTHRSRAHGVCTYRTTTTDITRAHITCTQRTWVNAWTRNTCTQSTYLTSVPVEHVGTHNTYTCVCITHGHTLCIHVSNSQLNDPTLCSLKLWHLVIKHDHTVWKLQTIQTERDSQ